MQKTSTKEILIVEAKKEFIKNGFKGASLRVIAENAGVTTGALYAHFTDKNHLFQSVVESTALAYEAIILDAQTLTRERVKEGELEKMWDVSNQSIFKIIDLIYLDKPLFNLLIFHSEGSSYGNFFEKIVQDGVDEAKTFFQWMSQMGFSINAVDEVELYILSHANYSAMYEIVKKDMTKEEAMAYMKTVIEFFRAGWRHILGF